MDELLSPTPLPDYIGEPLNAWAAEQPLVATVVIAAVLCAAAYLSFIVTRRLLNLAIRRIIARAESRWSVALSGRRFLHKLSYTVPLLVIRAGLPYLPALPEGIAVALQRIIAVLVVIAFVRSLVALVNAFGDAYGQTDAATERPIKGLLQVVTLALYFVTGILCIAMLLGRDPLVLLTGIGAASAVLMLIFQNTILSFVAGIQLTANDLLRIGDWIEMPDMNADGDVTEIALNTVTVQNWDKTFTIIPAHNFLNKSFKNWRGMQESGGRRIKRSLVIDMFTVRFFDEDDVKRLSKFALLVPYFEEKRTEIGAWIDQHPEAQDDPVNSRRLTNLGTFRAYVTRYLKAHPHISDDMTFLVRQLQPESRGLPLEIYVFVNDVRWAVYEGVQADIFDHLIAILPEFNLQLFQEPSGSDLRGTILVDSELVRHEMTGITPHKGNGGH